jgi:hypothetical protein
MIFQERALSQESMYFLKILISLSGAVMLATLPGFFDISYGVSGLTIRAAGGAAAFVFIYTQSPNIPNFSKPTAAPYSTTPAVTRPGTTSNNHRYDADSTPLLVALSFDPLGMASSTSKVTVHGEAGGPASPDGTMSGAGDGPVLGSSGTAPGGASAAVLTVVTLAKDGVSHLMGSALQVLDRLATALRTAISWLGAKASALIDQFKALNATPAADIQAFIASVPDAVADLLNSAATPATSAVGQLSVTLEHLPVSAGIGDTVGSVPDLLTSTVGDTVNVVGDLVTGVLHSPKDTLALTGKAVNDLTQGLNETTKGLTQSVNAHVADITEKLNDVAPTLIAPISPALGRLDAVTNTVHDLGDVTSALPPLTTALNGAGDLGLPQLRLPSGSMESRVEEVRGGCEACVLQPLDLGGRGDSRLGGGLGSGLAGLGLGRGGDSGGGSSSAAGGGASGPDGGGGGGPAGGGVVSGVGAGPSGGGTVSSAVGGVTSAVGNTASGLLGRRR